MTQFYNYAIYVMLERWIIFGKGNVPKKFKVVAMQLYGNDIKSIRNKVCPYCGRKFKNKVGLHNHLVHTKGFRKYDKNKSRNYRCTEAFSYMLNEIVEYTKELREAIRKSRGKYIVITNISPYPKARTIEEAVKLAINEVRP